MKSTVCKDFLHFSNLIYLCFHYLSVILFFFAFNRMLFFFAVVYTVMHWVSGQVLRYPLDVWGVFCFFMNSKCVLGRPFLADCLAGCFHTQNVK